MVRHGTICSKCNRLIEYIFCDDCQDWHVDPHGFDACDCQETYVAEEDDIDAAMGRL